MKLLGIYGSPRKGGNSDFLLNEALKGAESLGAEIHAIRSFDLTISGCRECGGCDKTGKCVVRDDMDSVYPQLVESEVIILASSHVLLWDYVQRKSADRQVPGSMEQANA